MKIKKFISNYFLLELLQYFFGITLGYVFWHIGCYVLGPFTRIGSYSKTLEYFVGGLLFMFPLIGIVIGGGIGYIILFKIKKFIYQSDAKENKEKLLDNKKEEISF
jgi:hypothetical protein